ncbi:nucleotidyltransferase family protein, partial [Bacillus atrophaeus ATCC 9372]
QVKNQANMHLRNGDPPYFSSCDAMRYWPELETALAARLNQQGQIELAAPFGITSVMAGQLTPNPQRPYALFAQRLQSKRWLHIWPHLRIMPMPLLSPQKTARW